MKTQEEKLEDLVTTRLFADLSAEEKLFVLEVLGSEEQFKSLQRIHSSLQDRAFAASPEPAADVLISLKRKMKGTERESFLLQAILQFKIPAYAALFLAVIAASIVAIVSNRFSIKGRTVDAPKLHIDTVYLTKTDTVYWEKLVVKYIRVPGPANPLMVTASVKSDKTLGVSMKDKEELDKLLVSGLN